MYSNLKFICETLRYGLEMHDNELIVKNITSPEINVSVAPPLYRYSNRILHVCQLFF
jgi:hypothetical protein